MRRAIPTRSRSTAGSSTPANRRLTGPTASWSRDPALGQRRWEELEQLEREGFGPGEGVLATMRGRMAFDRDKQEAERWCLRAVELLAGSGSPREIQSLQMLAILRFQRDPGQGIALLERTLAAGMNAGREAQLRVNLGIMYSETGDHDAAIRCIETGLQHLSGKVPSTRCSIASARCTRPSSSGCVGSHH